MKPTPKTSAGNDSTQFLSPKSTAAQAAAPKPHPKELAPKAQASASLAVGGGLASQEKTQRYYPDRNGNLHSRDRQGRYGNDSQYCHLTKPSAAIQYATTFAVGDYKIFDVEFRFDGRQFAFGVNTPNHTQTISVNKSVKDLVGKTPGITQNLVDSLEQGLNSVGIDFNNVLVKQIEIAGPQAGFDLNVGSDISRTGLSAKGQAGSVGLVLDTPLGELGATLNLGIKLVDLNPLRSKKGKPGVQQATRIALGSWEFSFAPSEQIQAALRKADPQDVLRLRRPDPFLEQLVDPFSPTPQPPYAKPTRQGMSQTNSAPKPQAASNFKTPLNKQIVSEPENASSVVL